MNLSEKLWNNNNDLALHCLNTKFVQGIKNGNLLNYEAGDFYHNVGTGVSGNINIQYVDAANTTSSINYKIFVKAESGSGNLNKDYNGATNGITSLVMMEIGV